MYPQVKIKKEWIQEGTIDETVEWAKSFGKYLQSNENGTGPLTTSQIRKFFGELKRIQGDPGKNQEEIPLLKAKLAYSVGRDMYERNRQMVNKTKIKEFYEELEKGINFIRPMETKDLNRFINIVESIVAFHKYFGGK